MYRVITNDVSDYIYLLVRIAHIFVIMLYIKTESYGKYIAKYFQGIVKKMCVPFFPVYNLAI
jgi:hypothetical protein